MEKEAIEKKIKDILDWAESFTDSINEERLYWKMPRFL
jgi:hypothetical protein